MGFMFLDQQRLYKLLVYAMNVPALKSPSAEGRLGTMAQKQGMT